MEDPKPLTSVAEFHRTFHHPIVASPGIPVKKRCDLRISLLREELDELEAAVEDRDLVEVADALCDLQYVLSGAILEFGMGDKFKTLFDEVQRSNMSKSCKTEEEAKQTVAFYKDHHDTECHYEESDGHYLVYRSADHKTIKSINYSPAALRKILED